MGARHLYNVLVEHPDLLCLTSNKTIAAMIGRCCALET